MQRWHAELAAASSMHRDGWTKDTLKPGDKITILGPAAKNGTFDMNLSHESRITVTDSGKVIHDSIAQGPGGPGASPGGSCTGSEGSVSATSSGLAPSAFRGARVRAKLTRFGIPTVRRIRGSACATSWVIESGR